MAEAFRAAQAQAVATRADARPLVAAWPLAAGLAALAALWLGPLPAMSARAFSPHMLLHLGVIAVAAPLIAGGVRRLMARVRGVDLSVGAALAAVLFDMAVVWGWHIPALHESAALGDGAFVLQQASFLGAGLLLWLVALSGGARAAAGIGMLSMLFTFMHMAMLGVLIALAPRLLYAPEVCLGAFGFDRLEDQQFGGALMAAGGGLPYLIAGCILAYRLIAEPADGDALDALRAPPEGSERTSLDHRL
jgi:putative membrane protein